jgi:hypothetical protein
MSFWQEIPGIGASGTVFNGASVTGGYTEQYANPAEISSIWSSVDMNSFRYYTVTSNPCSPLLAVPAAVYSINSLWKACAPGIYALYDPPYVLTPGSGLSVFSTTTAVIQDAPAIATTQASAGSTPAPVTAPITTAQTVASTNPVSVDSPALSMSTNDPPAQPATRASIDPSAQSPSTDDPPAQGLTSVNDNPVAASPGPNTPNSQPSAVFVPPVASTPATITIGRQLSLPTRPPGPSSHPKRSLPVVKSSNPLQLTLSPQKTLVWSACKSSLPPLLQHHPYLLTK